MKITIFVNKLTGGGAERVAAMWATGFCKNGHNVSMILSNNKNPQTYDIPKEVPIYHVGSTNHYKIFRAIDRIRKIHAILSIEHPDIIIDVIPAYWKRIAMFGIPGKKISTEHNSFERPTSAVTRHSKLKKIYLNRLYDHITVLTQADKNVIGKKLKNVTVLPNPLALEPAKELPEKKKIILATGRLDAWHYKGFDILIKAWAEIADKVDGWKLQIAGSSNGKGLFFLQKLCSELCVKDSVEFIGYQSDILPFYQDASIFVLSSRYEGFGLVLIEAMSQGCACIASDYKGRQKEIITSEEQGITCEPENIEKLSKAMLNLIQNDDKRKEIGNNAILRSNDFSIDNIMEKWNEIFQQLK